MSPLPWKNFVLEPFGDAQFMHPQQHVEEGPGPQHSDVAQPKPPPVHKCEGYYLSQLDVVDPLEDISEVINLGKEWSFEDATQHEYLEHVHKVATSKLLILQQGIQDQGATLKRLLEDAETIKVEKLRMEQMMEELKNVEEKLSSAMSAKLEKQKLQDFMAEMLKRGISTEELKSMWQEKTQSQASTSDAFEARSEQTICYPKGLLPKPGRNAPWQVPPLDSEVPPPPPPPQMQPQSGSDPGEDAQDTSSASETRGCGNHSHNKQPKKWLSEE